jgi:glutathione synthase
MMREASRRGHEVYAFELPDMRVEEGAVLAQAKRLAVGGDDAAWYREEASSEAPLAFFDAVLMRKDPPFDAEYYYATILLERAEAQGARVINAPRALRDWNEKLAILRFPQFAPATLVSRDPDRVHAFVDRRGRGSSSSTAWAARRFFACAPTIPTAMPSLKCRPSTAAKPSWRSATSPRSSMATSGCW